ncbi:DUF1501 domain-containing protein [Mycobacterium sp. SM1]|uniref:DUF1501 domain-containing protein n=1 Tax=Mycobacterium sp. SM1 TaxID=2816243 RepID=UPI001BCE05BD|nr:DUF1501 domain-containing protein [Mycobacterium sp. SM1]MBS4728320.1 DUF1501 domain-containing protein [Mycobacterium sp. SM1]
MTHEVMAPPEPTRLVVVQLSGGNDYLNTVVPYTDGRYYDFRPHVALRDEAVLPIDERVGFSSAMAPIARLYEQGKVAVIMGIGYPNHSRSHFRSMDIWHTAEPDEVRLEGWLAKVASLLDPGHTNPVLAVNFGRGLPRALSLSGVPVASVGSLDKYGLFPDLAPGDKRDRLLGVMERVYSSGPESSAAWGSARLLETGRSAQQGIEMLQGAAAAYRSSVEYPEFNQLAADLRGVATVMAGNLGTRIFYTSFGSFDTHTNELVSHARLWEKVSAALDCFLTDLDNHGLRSDTLILVFSEFGRRVAENNAGTDHGAGGVAFLIGNQVAGGLYGEYPNLAPDAQDDGDVRPSTDFRAVYASVLEQFLDVDPKDVLGRGARFDQLPLKASA